MRLMIEYLAMAAKQFKNNGIRTFLTILGILIGVAAMITVFSVGNSGKESIYKELTSFGINRILIYANESSGEMTVKDKEYLEKNVKNIEYISAQSFMKAYIRKDAKKIYGDIIATSPVLEKVENKEMLAGRYLNDTDMDYGRKVIVLSESTAEELFGKQDPVGQYVTMQNIKFKVVGVEKNTKPLYSAVTSEKSYIPLSAYHDYFGGNNIGEISISVATAEAMSNVAGDSLSALNSLHRDMSFRVVNMANEITSANNILDIFTLVVSAIAFISLIVGGIGIMNIMLVTVKERTKEIGIRKALGAREGSILRQFLAEAVLYSLVGSLGGGLLGALFTWAAGALISIKTSVSLEAVLFSILFSCAIGIFFGIQPALKAAKLDPVEALRYDH